MKINYTFVNGETSEIEVEEEIGNIILDSRRKEDNLARKERYHCYSMDAADFEGEDYADTDTPETVMERELEEERINGALGKLSETQRRRLLMLAEGMTVNEIARREGGHHSVVSETICAARKKFLKNF